MFEKFPESNIDHICIFNGYIGCPNCHCEECWAYKDNKFQTPVEHYYRFWFAYLQVNGEAPEGTCKRRLYARSGAQAKKDLSSKKHKIKRSKSEAKKADWTKGVYDRVKKDKSKRFGEKRYGG